MRRSSLSKKWIIAAFSFATIALAGMAALYLLSDPAESAPPVAVFHTCKTLHWGPLRLVDCGSATDGSLLVFSRFPERYLGDCGYWSGGPSGLLCSTVYGIIGLYARFATPNSALSSDTYLSLLRARVGAAKPER